MAFFSFLVKNFHLSTSRKHLTVSPWLNWVSSIVTVVLWVIHFQKKKPDNWAQAQWDCISRCDNDNGAKWAGNASSVDKGCNIYPPGLSDLGFWIAWGGTVWDFCLLLKNGMHLNTYGLLMLKAFRLVFSAYGWPWGMGIVESEMTDKDGVLQLCFSRLAATTVHTCFISSL